MPIHIHHNFNAPKMQAKVHPTNTINYQHCQNFTISMLPKFMPKFVQQHHKLPTLPKFHDFDAPKIQAKTHQQHHKLPTFSKFHKPPALSKLHHDQKIQHFKNAPKPTLQHDQSYNAPNSNRITQQHNDNVSTSIFQIQISNSELHVQIFTSHISNSKFSNSKYSNPKFFRSKLSIPNFQI